MSKLQINATSVGPRRLVITPYWPIVRLRGFVAQCTEYVHIYISKVKNSELCWILCVGGRCSQQQNIVKVIEQGLMGKLAEHVCFPCRR